MSQAHRQNKVRASAIVMLDVVACLQRLDLMQTNNNKKQEKNARSFLSTPTPYHRLQAGLDPGVR